MATHTDTARVAIVTGAGRGIGAAIARQLAHDGIRVALADLDDSAASKVASDIIDDGGVAMAVTIDVSDEHSVLAGVERVVVEIGTPTVLVNNAGILRDDLLFKMSTDSWDAVIDVHLRGAFLMSRAVQAHMTAAGFGRIVNLSSTSALGNRGQANYSAAKAGLQGLTKTLALELGKFGVTVNAVAPGFIKTDMTAATADRLGVSFDEFIAHSAAQIALARVGEPQDVARAVSYLVSDGAGYVSGQVLYVAGGPTD